MKLITYKIGMDDYADILDKVKAGLTRESCHDTRKAVDKVVHVKLGRLDPDHLVFGPVKIKDIIYQLKKDLGSGIDLFKIPPYLLFIGQG